MNVTSQTITYRPGTEADSYTTFLIFETAYADLLNRLGFKASGRGSDPEALTSMWVKRKSLYNHLARTADQFWIAESEGDPVGFSRSIVRGSLRELTELFVLPDLQSAGVGRALINRALPEDRTEYKTIIATTDFRAQTLYLRSGVYPRFPLYYFGKQPQARNTPAGLQIKPMDSVPNPLELTGGVDQVVIGHQRNPDHTWLMQDRAGFFYFDGSELVGYGYLGISNGPFALLNPKFTPAVLAHSENHAYEGGLNHFGVEVPMINQPAVDYLVENGFKLDSFMAVMMTNKLFGKFENYIATSPPFFL